MWDNMKKNNNNNCLMKDTYLSLAFVHGSTTQHSSLYTAVKVTTWGFGEKKKKTSHWGLHSIMSRRLYFGFARKISSVN